MTFLFHLLRDLWFLVAFLSAPENFRIILNLFVKILTILNSELGGEQRRITVDGAPPTTEAPSLPIEAEPRDDCDSAAIARWISSNSWALSEATWAWMLCFCRFKKEKSLQRTLQASFVWNNSYHFYERAISRCEFHISGENELKLNEVYSKSFSTLGISKTELISSQMESKEVSVLVILFDTHKSR